MHNIEVLPRPAATRKNPANYINRLERENGELREQVALAHELVANLEAYLLSSKFAGPDNDYVHVRTDMLPRLATIKAELLAGKH